MNIHDHCTHSHTVGSSVGSSLRLISNQDINVEQELLELNLEELRDERRREVENDDLPETHILASVVFDRRRAADHHAPCPFH